jgi:hypothetical protein
VLTLHWKARYPQLNRLMAQLELCKISALCQILLRETGHQVFGGPFSPMLLPDSSALCSNPQFIIGSYEEEVQDVINDIICKAPAQIIDIGASSGYYAVGFATKIANTTVTAFEAVEDPYWQQLADLARINGVGSKIIQRGLCTAEELAKTCNPKSFILCDCEGCEEDILQPILIPALESCTMLVELHEFYRPNLIGTLINRFRNSHAIRIIERTGRNPSRYFLLKKLPQSWRSIAVEDVRWIQRESSRIHFGARFMLLTPKKSTLELAE